MAVELPPVLPMEKNMLPGALRPWITDISKRTLCPLDFVAVAAVVAAASLIGRKVAIYPKQYDPWHEFPNLWGCVVGRSGIMKSPALAEGLAPLHALDSMARDVHAEAERDYQAAALVRGLEQKAALKKAAADVARGVKIDGRDLLDAANEEPPQCRRYVVNNFSLEALGEVLRANPSILVFQDELAGVLDSLRKPGNQELRPFLLQGWGGKEGFTFDRIGRGLNRHVKPFALSVLGGIQPGRLCRHLEAALEGGDEDDGFMQRFGLLVWPDVAGEWLNADRPSDLTAQQEAFAAMDALNAIEATEKPREVRFTPSAGELFLEWRTGLENRLRGGSETPAMESHLAKYRKLVPALALIFALLKDADAQRVEDAEIALAIRWAEYLESHAKRAYESVGLPNMDAAARLLENLMAGRLDGKVICARTIYRKGWSGLKTPDDATEALQVLERHGWLEEEEEEPDADGGRPRAPRYMLHPKAKSFFHLRRGKQPTKPTKHPTE